jgi:hypothetical protein
MRILVRLCHHKKLDFDMKNILFGDKGWKLGLFFNFGQFPCSWTWIRIQESQSNAGPCGSGYETLEKNSQQLALTQERKNLRVGSGS